MKFLNITDMNGQSRQIQVQDYQEVDPLALIPPYVRVGVPAGYETVDMPRKAFLAMVAAYASPLKIPAIKMLRQFVPGLGLKEAKDVVEFILDNDLTKL